jgi:hypothetical protein
MEGQVTSCDDSEDGAALCTCSTKAYRLEFERPEPIKDMAQCTEAALVCSKADEITLAGDVECEHVNQFAVAGGFCEGDDTCRQAATVEDLEFVLHGDLHFKCKPQSDGGWSCRCSTDAASVSMEIRASMESWEACEIVSEECRSVLGVRIVSRDDKWSIP